MNTGSRSRPERPAIRSRKPGCVALLMHRIRRQQERARRASVAATAATIQTSTISGDPRVRIDAHAEVADDEGRRADAPGPAEVEAVQPRAPQRDHVGQRRKGREHRRGREPDHRLPGEAPGQGHQGVGARHRQRQDHQRRAPQPEAVRPDRQQRRADHARQHRQGQDQPDPAARHPMMGEPHRQIGRTHARADEDRPVEEAKAHGERHGTRDLHGVAVDAAAPSRNV